MILRRLGGKYWKVAGRIRVVMEIMEIRLRGVLWQKMRIRLRLKRLRL